MKESAKVKLARLYKRVGQGEATVTRYLKVRFTIYAIFLVAALVLAFPLNFSDVAFPLLLLSLVGSGSTVISFLWIPSGKAPKYHHYFIIFADVLLVTVAVHYFGGIESTFSWAYVVILMAVALSLGVKAGIYAAILSCILYSGLLLAESAQFIPHIELSGVNAIFLHANRSYLYVKLLSSYALFLATVTISGYLARRLLEGRNNLEQIIKERTGELVEANRRLSGEVNDRRKAEERLAKSVALTHVAIESSPDGILVVGRKGRVRSYNQKFLRMWCIPEQIINSREDLEMPRHMLNQVKDSKRVAAGAKELFEHPEREHFGALEMNDGRIFEWYSNPHKIGDETFGVVVAFRDVRERNLTEELLLRSEQKYRTLFEESNDPIFISTPEGRILDMNLSGLELLGYSSKEELAHIDVINHVCSEEWEKFRAVMGRQGFVKDLEFAIRTKAGKRLDILITANAVREEKGKIVAYRGILRDITEQKQLQQQLFHAQKMESIGTLAGGIAHDFNNILGGILGYASFMKSKMEKDHPFIQYVDVIEKNSLRAAELTSQLLGFARGGKYDVKPVRVNKIVKETVKLLERTFDKSIEIQTQLTEPLPTVMADSGQIQQMLMNLLVNAADAMPFGGKLTIESVSEVLAEASVKTHMGIKAGPCMVLSVTDTGIGMDAETQKRIFEPFFTTKEEGKGTGLGLAMVYGVVKSHGGHISVYSEPGQGTTFRIYLPVSGEHEATELSETQAPSGNNELILVVDDDEPIRSFTEAVLQSNGYRVLLTEDGEQAIDVYKSRNGDIKLVILDMIMPKIGGHQAFLKMRAHNPQVRAILSTGYSQTGKAKEILDSGVIGFIQKPYQANTLLSKVKAALEQ